MIRRILTFWKSRNIRTVAKKQLTKNMEVIKSLRDYDEGKKNIPTNNIRKYLPNIRVASE